MVLLTKQVDYSITLAAIHSVIMVATAAEEAVIESNLRYF